MYSNFSYPDQLVQVGGFVLEIAVTRRQLCQVQLRRLKTSVWSRKLISLCLNLSKSGIGSTMFSGEKFSTFSELFIVFIFLIIQCSTYFYTWVLLGFGPGCIIPIDDFPQGWINSDVHRNQRLP